MDTIYESFMEQVSSRPNAVAVEDALRSVTFSELDALAATVQGMLPVGARRVGVVMGHGVEQIAAILGILRAGAAYVPAEPSFPDGRIRFMMEDCRADCIVTQRAHAVRVGGTRPLVLVERGLGAAEAIPSPTVGSPEDLAYVLYTSGSTGRPKGVAVTNRNVCHYACAFNHEFDNGPGDKMLQHSVCSFDIFVEEVFASLLNGAGLAIPSDGARDDLAALMGFVESCGVTMLSGFPYLLMEMNDLPGIPSCLRLLISGGDVLRRGYVSRLVGKVAVYNTYGPSETTVCATYFRCEPGTELDDGTYPVGHAVPGAEVLILDDELRPVAPGEVGEICIAGGGVSHGYIGNADRQAASFLDTPDGRRLYRSGDLGCELPSGDIAFLRRKDNQVMVWGRRVEPDGVESVLCSCGGVKTGAVRAYLDEHGLASYLVAYYVASGDVTEGDLRAEMGRGAAGVHGAREVRRAQGHAAHPQRQSGRQGPAAR
jgi:amino acid adenylation domain-containing protein